MIEKTIELRFVDGTTLTWEGEEKVNSIRKQLDSYNRNFATLELDNEIIYINKKNLIHVRIYGGE